MAHTRRYPSQHTDSSFSSVKRSPLATWCANEAQSVHPDRLDPYPLCAALENGYCQRQRSMAGVKRVLRGGPAEDPLQNYPTEEHQNAKRFCTRETAELHMDYVTSHLHEEPAHCPVIDQSVPMDTITTHHCNNFHRTKLQLYTLSEAGVGCTHSQLGVSVIDCPRCLAGQPGHLEHIIGPSAERMDTMG